MQIIQIFLCLLMFQSQASENIEKEILGTWEYQTYNQQELTYKKTSNFNQNKQVLHFKEGGMLSMRTAADQCGTPPIMYHSASGSWKYENEVLYISYNDWRGPVTNSYQVVKLNNNALILKRVPVQR